MRSVIITHARKVAHQREVQGIGAPQGVKTDHFGAVLLFCKLAFALQSGMLRGVN